MNNFNPAPGDYLVFVNNEINRREAKHEIGTIVIYIEPISHISCKVRSRNSEHVFYKERFAVLGKEVSKLEQEIYNIKQEDLWSSS